MKISFIGTGYVGLVSGVMMSHIGHNVVCIDVDEAKISKLQNKISPIFELGLDKYINEYANTSRLKFVCGYNESIKNSDCLFVTVGTPAKENGEADLTDIFNSLESALPFVSPECIIVMKSTIPPGT